MKPNMKIHHPDSLTEPKTLPRLRDFSALSLINSKKQNTSQKVAEDVEGSVSRTQKSRDRLLFKRHW